MRAVLAPLRRWPNQRPLLFLLLAAAAWFGLYQTLMPAADALVAALAAERASHLAGWVIGRLNMEAYLEDWVRDTPHTAAAVGEDRLSLGERLDAGFTSVREIVGKVWPYILAGIAIGAGIHGYVPQDFMASFMGRDAWWAVPLAVVIGVPMYTNAAGVIPIVQALLAKGVAVSLQKVEELRDIMGYGVPSTPGVVIDGKVVHAGGVPSRAKIEQWLAAAQT